MTIRDLGEAGIKLIGVYFGVSSVIGVLRVAGSMALPQLEGFPSPRQIALANASPILGMFVIAAVLVAVSGTLADRLFSERSLKSGVSRKDLLFIGIVLVGIGAAIGGIPGILRFASQLIWFAQGSKQSLFLPSMERDWQPLLNSALEVVVGGLLVATSGRLASVLDRRVNEAE